MLPFESDRAELLDLLLARGILRSSETQPVLSHDGTSARWMVDTLPVTLTPRGGELAGRCLLELLQRFEGRQLATYGLMGVPLLQSCVLQSGGRYHGLVVRKEHKQRGSLRLVEGAIDPAEPTILIDDSVSSGTSATEGIRRLEEAGLRVEGVVCLVRFEWSHGCARLAERGYHIEALYDIWDDFIVNMPDEPALLRNPSKWFPEFTWSSRVAPDGLHPAHLARMTLAEYFTTGQVLRPPKNLDRDYDASGGAWVSIRSREDVQLRHARDGFWHFPNEDRWSAPEGVIRAALRAAAQLPRETARGLIESSHIAVTFFSELEPSSVGQLDNERYGIVVRSDTRPWAMGGALPRMPGIAGEWAQYQHARIRNGGLASCEPHTIYRHEVVKAIEPGAAWQPGGVPSAADLAWHDDPAIGALIVRRARDIVTARIHGVAESTAPLTDDLLPHGVDSIYIAVYLDGEVRGCMGSVITRLDENVRTLALAALADERFEKVDGIPCTVAVTVSILYGALDLGERSTEEVTACFRRAEHALFVYQDERAGLLLPFVAVTGSLDEAGFVAAVIDKSGITQPPFCWRRFECATWIADAFGARSVTCGFPRSTPPPPDDDTPRRLAALHASYLVHHQEPDGSLFSRYQPFLNRLYRGATPPRLAHAAWVLACASRSLDGAALEQAAERILDYHLNAIRSSDTGSWIETGDEPPSVAEVAFLLLALCQLRETDPRRAAAAGLAATLWSSIDLHGHIRTHRPPATAPDEFQDYFPGQVLLALAEAAHAGICAIDRAKLQRALRFYHHRFRYKRSFGQVSWLMQAFSAWWRVTQDPEYAAVVFEIGDWILGYQQEKTGAFINDHQPDTPGYTTALYLEGIAAAAELALLLSDPSRHERFAESARRGFQFLDRLVIQPRDCALLPNPHFAVGGLRASLTSSEVRIDFVQHSLSAAMRFCSQRKQQPRPARPLEMAAR